MRRAYYSALGLVGNHDDALDLSQEAFIRAFRALPRFDVEQPFFTWYYRILRNLCLNHLRDRSKFAEKTETALAQTADTGADPSVLAERNDLMERLWRAISFLKSEHREILVLKDIEGCSYQEIAARLGIPKGTVMSRLFSARRSLREHLGKLL